MAQFTRTTIEGGVRTVQLFATTEKAFARQIAVLDELLTNNAGYEPITKPAAAAKDALAMLLSTCKGSFHRVDTPLDEDTADAKGQPATGTAA